MKELKIISITMWKDRHITEWEDGSFTVSGMKHTSLEAARAAIDKIQNMLMIGRIK